MGRRPLAVTLLAGISIAVSACTAPPEPNVPPPQTPPHDEAVRMAVVGDSITAGDSQDLNEGVPGPLSWTSYAAGPEVEFVGGWAEWGATTERMAEAVTEPFDADVLVVLAGTNDVTTRSHQDTAANLVEIVETAEVDRVLLSSVPPNDHARERTTELNAFLRAFAAEHGWEWVDAAAPLRDGDRFQPDMTSDGIHPSEAGARALGSAIGAAVAKRD